MVQHMKLRGRAPVSPYILHNPSFTIEEIGLGKLLGSYLGLSSGRREKGESNWDMSNNGRIVMMPKLSP